MIRHEDASKAGVKRVILKSTDWDENYQLIRIAIKTKWGLQLGEDCHAVIGDWDVNCAKSLETAFSLLKDVNKVNVVVKDGESSSGDADIFEILINGKEADCKENINVTILKVTTEDANEAYEEWMANYEDVLSGIGTALRDDDWTKSYSLVDDEADMEINTIEDFRDSVEATAEDNNGAPICFTLKSVK